MTNRFETDSNTVAQLEDLGHRVLHSKSGNDALEILAAQPVELLITDYAMPSMTGIQLAEAAQARRPGLPVILVSGYADLGQQHSVRVSKLSKPFVTAELGRAIEGAIEPLACSFEQMVTWPPVELCSNLGDAVIRRRSVLAC